MTRKIQLLAGLNIIAQDDNEFSVCVCMHAFNYTLIAN